MIKIGGKIGIIGGGQLARMIAIAAYNLGYKIAIYSDNENSSAAQITKYLSVGSYFDKDKILKFASEVDVLTYEFENIDYQILLEIEKKFPNKLRPNAYSLFTSNNRLREKEFFTSIGVAVAPYKKINSIDDIRKAIFEENFQLPAILKTTENGYDGKGQWSINNSYDLNDIELNEKSEYVLEQKIHFKKEVSLIIARDKENNIETFPIPHNIHKNGILHTSSVPSNLPSKIENQIIEIGKKTIAALNYIGVMAIEFFIDKNDEIIVNEMAPRVHNSGHYTMNGCNISQFEQHVRAICDLPLKHVELIASCKMRNLIGDEIDHWMDFAENQNAFLHIYDKGEAKSGRKMAHVNILKEEISFDGNEIKEDGLWDETLLNTLIKDK